MRTAGRGSNLFPAFFMQRKRRVINTRLSLCFTHIFISPIHVFATFLHYNSSPVSLSTKQIFKSHPNVSAILRSSDSRKSSRVSICPKLACDLSSALAISFCLMSFFIIKIFICSFISLHASHLLTIPYI